MGSVIFDFLYNHFGAQSTIWLFYIVNFVFAAIAYKLGFARELPLLKSVLVYVMLAVGTIILTIFSLVKLPITEVLIIITVVLAIYRFRLYRERNTSTNNN